MLIFLSVVVCTVLVTVFVIALRRHHQKAFSRATEREQGLPPLTDVALDIGQLMPEEFDQAGRLNSDFFETSAPGDTASDGESVHQTTASHLTTPVEADHNAFSAAVSTEPVTIAEPQPPPPEDTEPTYTEAAPAETTHTVATTSHPEASDQTADTTPSEPAVPSYTEPPTGDWKQRAMYWRDQTDYEQALACCGEAWPQWQSYQQAAVIMRAAIKNASTEELVNDWYDRLYHLAIQASVLHDRIEGLPDLTRQQIVATFSRADLDALGTPWQDVGCNRLRLLTKSDRRNLTALYGVPDDHKSAKSWFQHLL